MSQAKPALRIKGRSFVAIVLMPEPPVEDWLAALAEQLARSPAFFDGRPVIVDFTAMAGLEAEFDGVVAALEKRDMRIIGVEGWPDDDVWGRPPIATNGRADRFMEVVDETPEEPPAPPEPTALVLQGPIRSGQTVIFEGGDVTVLGAVASGAEVIAGGSIHVYGALRGRAVAGFMGQSGTRGGARVFCTRMEAELIAIDGIYKIAEDMPAEMRGKPVQAMLDGDSVIMVCI